MHKYPAGLSQKKKTNLRRVRRNYLDLKSCTIGTRTVILTYVELLVIRVYNAQQKIISSVHSGSGESDEAQFEWPFASFEHSNNNNNNNNNNNE